MKLVWFVWVFGCVYAQTSFQFFKYEDLRGNLTAIPVNATQKTQTIQSLKKIVPSYVFNAIATSSPTPQFPMKVELLGQLDQIAKSDYPNDAALQQAIADVFIPLHDAHTRYNKPPPYGISIFAQPILLEHKVVDGRQGIYARGIRPDLNDAYLQLYNVPIAPINITQWTVVTIDGNPAFETLLQFANTSIGYSKDLGTRFNLAVNGYGDGYGYWGYRSQQAFGIPPNPTVEYILCSPSNRSDNITLNVYWIGLQKITKPSFSFSTFPMKTPKITQLDLIRSQFREAFPPLPSSLTVSVNEEVNGGVTFMDIGNGTGVLGITTFAPNNTANFISFLETSIVRHQQQGGNKLIIDLRANGGGDICLGYATARFLFPSMVSLFAGHYDLIKSDLFSMLGKITSDDMKLNPQNYSTCGGDPEVVGYFAPCAWYGWNNSNMPFADNQWLENGKNYTRGADVQRVYSQKIHEGCSAQFSKWVTPQIHRGYDPANVLLLSDGLCGSTCAVFSSFIQMNGLGKTIVLGGIKDEPMQFFSFPGGEVETIDYIYSVGQKYGASNDDLMPQPFANGATFRFAIREIYPWTYNEDEGGDDEAALPLEYVFVPAHFHLPYISSANDTTSILRQVLPYFSQCAYGVEMVTCYAENGVGFKLCIDGNLTDNCILTNCNSGYRLKLVNTSLKHGEEEDHIANDQSSSSIPVLSSSPASDYIPSPSSSPHSSSLLSLPRQNNNLQTRAYLPSLSSSQLFQCVKCDVGYYRLATDPPKICSKCVNADSYSGEFGIRYTEDGVNNPNCPFKLSSIWLSTFTRSLILSSIALGGVLFATALVCFIQSKRNSTHQRLLG